MSAEKRLLDLGITLPELPEPMGNYVHAVRSGSTLFLSGKGPVGVEGKVGAEVTTQQAYECARQTGLVLLAAMRQELGTLDRVSRVVKVLGFVNAAPGYAEHPAVINGCSDLFVSVFGENGRHARSAIGAGSLPSQIPVEIEAIVEIKE